MRKYRIIDQIGKGAFCSVFKGYDIVNHRFVAIKKYLYAFDDIKDKIMAEIETLKMTNHPNIITLFEAVVENNQVFLIFDLQHCTLIQDYKQIKRRHEWLSQDTIKCYIYQVALALDFLHSNHLMHRDIKPENVMMKRGTKVIKLIDFGFCKKVNKTPLTDYISTRWYRAPELVLGMKYGFPVDVFALGCLMLELYNGVQVFRGETSLDQIYKICEVLGNIRDWKEGSNRVADLGIQMKYMPRRLHRLTSSMNKQGIQLIEQMLTFNPNKRLSIKEVLLHRYFNDVELPTQVLDYLRNKRHESNGLKNINNGNRISLIKHRRMNTQIQQVKLIKPTIVIPPLSIPSIPSVPPISSVSPVIRQVPSIPLLGLKTLNRYDSNHQLIYTDRSSTERNNGNKPVLTSRQYKYVRITQRQMLFL